MYCKRCGLPCKEELCDVCGAAVNNEPSDTPVPAQTATPPPPVIAPSLNFMPPAKSSPPRMPFDPLPRTEQPIDAPLRVGQYIGMFFLLCIPLVNIILLFVWAFGNTVNYNKRNFARAYLILTLIAAVITILCMIRFWGYFISIMEMGGYNY